MNIMKIDNKCYKIIIEGRVQGVGFRYFAQSRANIRSVNGSIKNCTLGNVEIIACGTQQNIDTFILDLYKGPPLSRIHNLNISELSSYIRHENFKIIY